MPEIYLYLNTVLRTGILIAFLQKKKKLIKIVRLFQRMRVDSTLWDAESDQYRHLIKNILFVRINYKHHRDKSSIFIFAIFQEYDIEFPSLEIFGKWQPKSDVRA